jgi:hypothetical protein
MHIAYGRNRDIGGRLYGGGADGESAPRDSPQDDAQAAEADAPQDEEPQAVDGIDHGGPGLVADTAVDEWELERIEAAEVNGDSIVVGVADAVDPDPTVMGPTESVVTIRMLQAEDTEEGIAFTGRADYEHDAGSFVVHSNDLAVRTLRCGEVLQFVDCAHDEPDADHVDDEGVTYDEHPLADEEVLAVLTPDHDSVDFEFTAQGAGSHGELFYALPEDDALWGNDPGDLESFRPEASMCFDLEIDPWPDFPVWARGGYNCGNPVMY